jgi:spore protease
VKLISESVARIPLELKRYDAAGRYFRNDFTNPLYTVLAEQANSRQTAFELLRGAVECVRPDVVLVIDALAARSCERLSRTVQLSDVGIAPGSGVGNHRCAITHETLGVPVIALGVPTVVNSATLVYDALHEAGIEEADGALQRVLETGKSFFVSPKESDVITKEFSTLLADAVSRAFLGELHGVL